MNMILKNINLNKIKATIKRKIYGVAAIAAAALFLLTETLAGAVPGAPSALSFAATDGAAGAWIKCRRAIFTFR